MKWIFRFHENYRRLEGIAQQIGKEYERHPYQELAGGSADQTGGTLMLGDVAVKYSAYSVETNSTGAVCFCVDLRSRLPTFLGIKPSYQFWKRPDGSVYY